MKYMFLGKIKVNTFNQTQALEAIDELVSFRQGGSVFTPNVDHFILAEENESFADAYRSATISLADGMPVVWASHLLGPKIPERVAGSDMFVPLMRLAWMRDWRVAFVGSSPEVLQKTSTLLDNNYPSVRIVAMTSPTVSSSPTVKEVSEIVDQLEQYQPDLVIVALGAPKQELFIYLIQSMMPRTVFCGFGAALDFFSGEVKRAPKWMRSVGLEWLYRLLKEPKRMWKRYLRDFKFPLLVLKQWWNNYTG